MTEVAHTAWYRQGTVTVTVGSTKVIGEGTNWTTAGIKPGATFRLDERVSPAHEVARVVSDNELELVEPFRTMARFSHNCNSLVGITISGQTYSIDRHNQSMLPADFVAKLAELVGYDITNIYGGGKNG